MWFHLVQPVWSLDLLAVPHRQIRTRTFFTPHEVPLSVVEPEPRRLAPLALRVGQAAGRRFAASVVEAGRRQDLGDRLTVYDLLVTARHRPTAIALGEAGGARTRSLAALLGVPCVTAVQGIFRWAADGDLALVDGDHGLVVLNPSRADVQQVRASRGGSAGGEGG